MHNAMSFFSRVLRMPAESAEDRRHAGRLPMESSLHCNLGQVIDLSATGVGLLSRRALQGRVQIQLSDAEGGFCCEAMVVRCHRLGFFRHDVGIQLPPLDDQARALMTRFCALHRDKLVMAQRKAA